jgi:glycosyltransferase involved in cell wall biosynthesis
MINRIIITGPSLDLDKNIGGISSVVSFIIRNNKNYYYYHFELGKHDNEKRASLYLLRLMKAWLRWFIMMISSKGIIVHFNISLEKLPLLRDSPLIFWARLLKRKMVIHLHGGAYLHQEIIPRWARRNIIRILRGKEPKIVLSTIEQEKVIKRYKAENVIVLPNSLDIKDARMFVRDFFKNEILKILFIGRIVKNKGIDYIYEALQELRDDGIQFEFIMAGEGIDRKEYISIFTELLESSFRYEGVVSGDKKDCLLKECDVYLLPSFYEGLPVSMLECMAYAMVPVVTGVGSISYVVKNRINGIIIQKKSSYGIVNAIKELSFDKEIRKKMGLNAQLYVLKNFDPRDYIRELNRVYSIT